MLKIWNQSSFWGICNGGFSAQPFCLPGQPLPGALFHICLCKAHFDQCRQALPPHLITGQPEERIAFVQPPSTPHEHSNPAHWVISAQPLFFCNTVQEWCINSSVSIRKKPHAHLCSLEQLNSLEIFLLPTQSPFREGKEIGYYRAWSVASPYSPFLPQNLPLQICPFPEFETTEMSYACLTSIKLRAPLLPQTMFSEKYMLSGKDLIKVEKYKLLSILEDGSWKLSNLNWFYLAFDLSCNKAPEFRDQYLVYK